jgi:hypothetical protein
MASAVRQKPVRAQSMEPIAWYKIRDVFRDHVTPLAGEGNAKYFIEASMNLLRSEHHDKS